MGLVIEDTLPINSSIVVDTISTHIPFKVCTDGSSSSPYEETNSFDKSIYRVFSMQDDMKTLMYPERVKNEFDLYVQYAEAKTIGAVDSNFDLLDTYLGAIGVTNGIC